MDEGKLAINKHLWSLPDYSQSIISIRDQTGNPCSTLNRTNRSPKRPNRVTKCSTRGSCKRGNHYRHWQKGCFIRTWGWPGGLLLANGQRLPNKGKKRESLGRGRTWEIKGRIVWGRAHRGVWKGSPELFVNVQPILFLVQVII